MSNPTVLVKSDPSAKVDLLPSLARTVSGVSATFYGLDWYGSVLVELAVTAANGTLDVFLQTLLPDGTTWTDLGKFAQVTSASKRYLSLTSGGGLESAVQDAAMTTVGSRDFVFGEAVRVKYVITGTSFTFSVPAIFIL